MNWETHVLFEVNDLFDFEPEELEGLDRIDRRTAVKNIVASRIRRNFGDLDDVDLLSRIENPQVLREAAIFLNLNLVFYANSTGGGVFSAKAEQYANRFEMAIRQAMELLRFDGLERSGVTLVR
jgi:hypothetical protein